MTFSITRSLLTLSFLTLAACGPIDRTPVAPKTQSQGALQFSPQKTYVAWKVSNPGALIKETPFCPLGSQVFTKCQFGATTLWTPVKVVILGGTGDGQPTRISLPDGGALDIVEIETAGDYFPVWAKSVRDGVLIQTVIPSFSLTDGAINYLGSYSGGTVQFVKGAWDPEGLKADLTVAGRADLAKAVYAKRPRQVRLYCPQTLGKGGCNSQDVGRDYPLLVPVE